MSASRRYLMLLAIVLVSALPATGAFLFYQYTKDPLLQPLGITREKLAEIDGQSEFVTIIIHVDWGSDRGGELTKAELRGLLAQAFAMHTDAFIFKFREVPGKDIGVTFAVGPNRYGPYPPDRMVDGIIPSTVALAMTKAFREDAQATAEADTGR